MTKSVLIVDDNEAVRCALRVFFAGSEEWIVAGEVADGTQAIQKAIELKPDLILLDFRMPGLNGVEAASKIRTLLPAVWIVVFTLFNDSLGLRLSSVVGIDLVISKSDGTDGLIRVLRRLVAAPRPSSFRADPADFLT